jgi:hypothetical protein
LYLLLLLLLCLLLCLLLVLSKLLVLLLQGALVRLCLLLRELCCARLRHLRFEAVLCARGAMFRRRVVPLLPGDASATIEVVVFCHHAEVMVAVIFMEGGMLGLGSKR